MVMVAVAEAVEVVLSKTWFLIKEFHPLGIDTTKFIAFGALLLATGFKQ
jgi:hypothetical protein